MAAVASNQWNAWATVTASTDESSSGIASAVPASTATSGSTIASWARMPGTGSTATISAPVPTSIRVSLPVPAARSHTRRPGPIPTSAANRSIASGGYPGRAAS